MYCTIIFLLRLESKTPTGRNAQTCELSKMYNFETKSDRKILIVSLIAINSLKGFQFSKLN